VTREIKHGSTDQSVTLRAFSIVTGLPATGLTHATAGLALWYRRQGGLQVAITPVAVSEGLDDAHADGRFIEIGDGYYRLDLPDAACATGAADVVVGGAATGYVFAAAYHPLVANTAADVAAAVAALENLSQSEVDAAISANSLLVSIGNTTGAMNADLMNGGRLDLIFDATLAAVDTEVAAIQAILQHVTYGNQALLSAIQAVDGDADTLLTRLTADRATKLDNLDAAISTRLATTGYTAPPEASVIATLVDSTLTGAHDAGSWATANLATLESRLSAARALLLDNLADLYHADIEYTVDGAATHDEFTVRWFKNGQRITAGITTPTLTVVKRDGTTLINAVAMTQIGTTGAYGYDATTTSRLPAGDSAEAVVTATIDGSARTFSRRISRDSEAA
jgi:hypothetical protein